MRKAAGGLTKRGSRRAKQQQHHQNDGEQPQNHNDSSHHQERRKQTPEEAALTAKNYRLAKELSDLRVRHRDETKNVTRLTMENMNLAARCREAISHVSMLKKELAMHQKRAAEALALQRQQSQQTQRTTSNVSNISENGSVESTEDIGAEATPASRSSKGPSSTMVEMEPMDRLVAAHAAPAINNKSSSEEEDNVEASPDGEFFADFSASSTMGSSKGSSPTSSEESHDKTTATTTKLSPSNQSVTSQQSETSDISAISGLSSNAGVGTSRPMDDRLPGFFPHSASPHVRRKNYNDDYPADITPASIHHERRLPAVEDIKEQENDTDSFVSQAREEAIVKLSSIDAFEASFSTPFPESFSGTSPTSEEQKQKETSEIYNPFFSSPAKPPKPGGSLASSRTVPERPSREEASMNSTSSHNMRERSPVSRNFQERSPVSSSKNVRESSPVAKNIRGRSPVTSRTMESSGGRDGSGRAKETPPGPPGASPSASPTLSAMLNRQRQKIEEDERSRNSNGSQRRPDPSSSPNLDNRNKSVEEYHTPPQSSIKSPEAAIQQPRRPEKTISSSARARYERALHPRGEFGGRPRGSRDGGDEEGSVSSSTAGDTEEVSKVTSHSPSMVLKRLQQRRERGRGALEDPSVDSRSSTTVDLRTTSSASMQSYRSMSHGQLGGGPGRSASPVAGGGPGRSASPVRSSSPVAEARRKFEGDRRSSRPTPAERDMHALPSDEEDELVTRAERSLFSQNARTLAESRKAANDSFGRNTSSPIPPLHRRQSSEENRALDTLAAKTSMGGDAALHAGPSSSAAARYMDSIKARRAVKQPVSYAEPSLNSKLRRGDVYFPKTTPESSHEPSGGRHEDRSTSKEADEMLKDLAGPVRS